MTKEITNDIQTLLEKLNSLSDTEKIDAIKGIKKLGYSSKPVLEKLENVARLDHNKFVRYSAKNALKKLKAVAELSGTDGPLSELSERDLLERLIVLQIENDKAISNTLSVILGLLFVLLGIVAFSR